MKAWPKHNVSVDADYEPPSVNRWTSEDDLVQRLFAPPPIEPSHEPYGIGEDIWIGALIVLLPLAVFVLLTH
jgi:hypothetical protein